MILTLWFSCFFWVCWAAFISFLSHAFSFQLGFWFKSECVCRPKVSFGCHSSRYCLSLTVLRGWPWTLVHVTWIIGVPTVLDLLGRQERGETRSYVLMFPIKPLCRGACEGRAQPSTSKQEPPVSHANCMEVQLGLLGDVHLELRRLPAYRIWHYLSPSKAKSGNNMFLIYLVSRLWDIAAIKVCLEMETIT